MFESSFRKLGIISQRNRKKIIVFWIILFIAMLPFASLLFTNTSYNLENSIVTKNSMSAVADSLLSSEFQSSTGTGNGSSLVIVTNNTPVNDPSLSSTLQHLLGQLDSYFHTLNDYTGMTSVYSLENSTLYGVVPNLSKELTGTSSLINGTTKALNQTSGIMSFQYGLPAIFLDVYNINFQHGEQPEQASEAAYNATIANASKIQLLPAIPYVNTFSGYWNNTFSKNLQDPISVLNGAMNQTIINNASFRYIASTAVILSLMGNIVNITPLSVYLGNPQEAVNTTISTIVASGYSANPEAEGLIATLNVTPGYFVNSVLKIGLAPGPAAIESLSVSLLVNSTISLMAHNPLISVNPGQLKGMFETIYNYGPEMAISEELGGNSFSKYAILPSPYVFHQFVGYDNSTTIIIASFSDNVSQSVIDHINTITSNYTNSIPNSKYLVAGSSALDNQLAGESLNGMIKALIIGIILSVIIIGLFFRSPIAAFIPLTIFGFSAVISMGINGLIYKYILHTTVSFITPTLLLILILGLTSDYIVYIMARYRQEMRRNSRDPIPEAAQWAGHAVFTSGITVALSYLVLWIANVPLFSDSGLTNAIGVTVSILLANTLLISLLAVFGTRLYWPSKIVGNRKFAFEHTMTKIAGGVLHNKKKIVVVFVLFAIFGLYFYAVTPSSMNVFALVPNSTGIQALEQVNSSFHGDFFDRGYIILNFTSPLVVHGKYNTTEMSQVTDLENSLLKDGAISQVYGPTYPFGYYVNLSTLSSYPVQDSALYYQYVNQSIGLKSNYAMVTFQLAQVAWGTNASSAVSNMPSIIKSSGSDLSYTYDIGGLTQGLNDAYTYTATTFSNLVPILALAVFVILMIQLSSLLAPVRLIIMVMAAVVVSLALTYILYFNFLGLPILIFLPLFSFITLLAVGLDYDIFMITRAREAVIKGMSNEDAIKTSIIENGGVIITLGLLLFAIFFSLTFSGIGIIEEIGTGLALGVFVDTFISWPFFGPAIMLLMKKYNWWPSKIYKVK
jgi:RND superfamily putative drug exporter